MTTAAGDQSVTVVGLGAMGSGMTETLVRAGRTVTGIDPSPAAREATERLGIRCAASLADAAPSRYAVLSLPGAEQVRQVAPLLLGWPEVTVVDTTTSEPALSADLAGQFASAAGHFVDAPVSGGRAGAVAGALSAFVGAQPAALQAARPLLDALTGGQWRHLGPPGSGNVAKLLNNVLCATNLAAVAEALDVAAAYGMDPVAANEALAGASGGSTVGARMFPTWVLSGTFDSHFTMGLMSRDVALALQVAHERGAQPSVLETTARLWAQALARLGPSADFTASTRCFTTATTTFGTPSAGQPE